MIAGLVAHVRALLGRRRCLLCLVASGECTYCEPCWKVVCDMIAAEVRDW